MGACEGGDDANDAAGAGGVDRPRVVASTALIAQFAERVAGEDASVEALIPAGVDVHAFALSGGSVRTIAEADLLLVNGHNLEEGLLDVIVENRGGGVPLVAVSEGIEAIVGGDEDDGDRGDGGDDPVFAGGDPHLWLDVANAARYVERIRDALAALDPAHADRYRERAATAVAALDALDAELREAIAAIPPQRRRIVVFHDAYRYFARAYGFELTASVLPGNPNQQTSAAELAAVIEIVREQRVPALYAEPQFRAQALEAVAVETGARVLTLYSVPIGGEVATYEAMMRANVAALVEGLAP